MVNPGTFDTDSTLYSALASHQMVFGIDQNTYLQVTALLHSALILILDS